ncbi:hypothetical protein Tco_1231273 [Tanacetum coccineum]
MSILEATCFELRDEVLGYKLFKERIEAVQDEQVKILSNKVVAEANYVVVVNALCAVDFHLLAQLASHKDASMSELMDLLRLEGLTVETLEANQLQPSPEQLMLPIYRPKDQVVIGETSLSYSLDVIHARFQRIRGDVAACRLSLSDAMVPLIEPLSAENLIGESSSIPPVSAVDYEVSGAEQPTEVPSPPKIVFEKEELETTPVHAMGD